MLKKITKSILLSFLFANLVACNEKNKHDLGTIKIDTGAVECDRYIALILDLQNTSQLPAESEESIKKSIEEFRQMVEKNPDAIKGECNAAYSAMRGAIEER